MAGPRLQINSTQAGRVGPEQIPRPREDSHPIQDYYTNLSLRESSGRSTLDWHRLEKGITDCTISASLFALAMNVLVKSAGVECKGSLLRAFVNLALDNP